MQSSKRTVIFSSSRDFHSLNQEISPVVEMKRTEVTPALPLQKLFQRLSTIIYFF
jgi:hypothetical protein